MDEEKGKITLDKENENIVKNDNNLNDDDIAKKENDKKRKKKILIIVLIVVLLIGGIGTTVFLLNKDDVKENYDSKKDDVSNDEEENKDDEDHSKDEKHMMQIYGSTGPYGEDVLCMDSNYCEAAFLIPVYTDNAEVLDVAYDNYVLYRDDKIYLYNHDTETASELNLEMNANNYVIHFSNNSKELYGISYVKNDKASYFNLENQELLYENMYNAFHTISDDYVYAEQNIDDNDVMMHLLNGKEEKKPLLSEKGVCVSYSKKEFGNEYYLLLNKGCSWDDITFYTSDLKKIFDSVETKYYSLNKKGELFIYNDKNKVINKYNFKGEVVNSIKVDGTLESVHEELYLVKKNNAIYIKEYTGNEYKLLDWKEDYYYHSPLSRYYEADELNNEEEKKAGYYFIFQYDSSGEGPGVEFYFDPVTKKIDSWDLEEIGGYAKPVLYLYPEKEMDVEVNFEHEDSLTTTYPKFKDSWKVKAKPNGDLYDKDGKYYYGLYWEEDSNHRIDFKEGFYVTKDNAIEFLEEKLSIIGLNDRERNEFIMYWLPILEKNGQNLVYFELTEERESFNKLEITPKPDSMLRVAIHVKKVNNKVKIKEQKLTSFNRVGFTAVEWGGVLYN